MGAKRLVAVGSVLGWYHHEPIFASMIGQPHAQLFFVRGRNWTSSTPDTWQQASCQNFRESTGRSIHGGAFL